MQEEHRVLPSLGMNQVRSIVAASGLRQSELARRAGIPRSVLSAYVNGARRPRADALTRLAAAAGMDLVLRPRTPPVDAEEAGRRLVQVLGLAEALPYRPRATNDFPGLPPAGGGGAR